MEAITMTLCQNGSWQTWHLYSIVQNNEDEAPLYQQCGVWIMVLSWLHQALYELQHDWICYGLTYSTKHMAAKDRNQDLKGEGIGTRVRHILIAAKVDIFASL